MNQRTIDATRGYLLPWTLCAGILAASWTGSALADGLVKPPAEYAGSLEERSQQAMIVFRPSSVEGRAREDLILSISVEGDVEEFAWVIPLPNEPEVKPVDGRIFKELFDYVERRPKGKQRSKGGGFGGTADVGGVEVVSRDRVGVFDVTVVRERTAGSLNGWLSREGYQAIEDGEDVIEHYRERKYVFACVKVTEAARQGDEPVDLHPLWFSFRTGGRDGIYFPMKLTSLQRETFDVNLYVFSPAKLNNRQNFHGFQQRGFREKFEERVVLNDAERQMPGVVALLRSIGVNRSALHLTNVQGRSMQPRDVRRWNNDLWLFPRHRDASFVPHDARPGGPAMFGPE